MLDRITETGKAHPDLDGDGTALPQLDGVKKKESKKRGASKPKPEEPKVARSYSPMDYGFVHHVFENTYFKNKGKVWGPTNIDSIVRTLRARFNIKDEDIDDVLLEIEEECQIYQAANVAGYPMGVHHDIEGHPHLVLQSHKLVQPADVDWTIIKVVVDSMFGEVQAPYVWGWMQWAYHAYENRTLAPGWLFVMVGPNDCGKSLLIEQVISPLLGSKPVKCQKYLTDTTEFNADLVANCTWTLSDALSKMNWEDRRILTENLKDALVSPVQRLRSMYTNPCVVNMCPRIVAAINFPAIGALPIFEDGMGDKMSLFKVEKSSLLPETPGDTPFHNLDRLAFEKEIAKARPGLAYYLKNLKLDPQYRETGKNVRFNVKVYHHPEILAQILDTKPHVSLAAMLLKWWYVYPLTGSALDIWASLTDFGAESREAVRGLAKDDARLGRLLTALAKATEKDQDGNMVYCNYVNVHKPPRGHDDQKYEITFQGGAPQPPKPSPSPLQTRLRSREELRRMYGTRRK